MQSQFLHGRFIYTFNMQLYFAMVEIWFLKQETCCVCVCKCALLWKIIGTNNTVLCFITKILNEQVLSHLYFCWNKQLQYCVLLQKLWMSRYHYIYISVGTNNYSTVFYYKNFEWIGIIIFIYLLEQTTTVYFKWAGISSLFLKEQTTISLQKQKTWIKIKIYLCFVSIKEKKNDLYFVNVKE